MSRLSRLLSYLLLITATACVSNQPDFMAADGEDEDVGLGGTGLLATTVGDEDNGLGGTGIVGAITGYGSIFVNGVEVEYHPGTPFTIDGKIDVQQQLEIGDVVEVLTIDSAKHTQARLINLRHEVIGKVESVDVHKSSFMVLGQTIINVASSEALPKVGSMVAIAGFRIDEQTIQASRVSMSQSEQTLLRQNASLPFTDTVNRWLLQTYVHNHQVSLMLDDHEQILSLQQKTHGEMKADSGIKILQLQKSGSDTVSFDSILDQDKLPHGRQHPATDLRFKGHVMPGMITTPDGQSLPGAGFRLWPVQGAGGQVSGHGTDLPGVVQEYRPDYRTGSMTGSPQGQGQKGHQ